MHFQGVVMNVADLNRSIDFYREVLGFTLLAQEEQLATVGAPGSDRTQAIVLRQFANALVSGAGHIGLQAFVLEAESADQLERIASELDSRRLFISRHVHSEWTAIVGRDPDRATIVVAWHPDGGRAPGDAWRLPDDFLYGIGA